ncbi:MAG: hypothetical protein L6R43_19805 [Planctomycetes bacterium]|nr:hypothetical protein [Planctomycetota bacterium]
MRRAVRWNSPLYGVEGRGRFLGVHVLARFVRVTFLRGSSLHPLPLGGTPGSGESRRVDLHEGEFYEGRLASWVGQAAALPGWIP